MRRPIHCPAAWPPYGAGPPGKAIRHATAYVSPVKTARPSPRPATTVISAAGSCVKQCAARSPVAVRATGSSVSPTTVRAPSRDASRSWAHAGASEGGIRGALGGCSAVRTESALRAPAWTGEGVSTEPSARPLPKEEYREANPEPLYAEPAQTWRETLWGQLSVGGVTRGSVAPSLACRPPTLTC